ncbi:MAG: hypothetical protein P4L86_16905 [Mycobacterium sp.]|nr:hypothetical protein [Mycobacterium sp.]
MITLISVPGTGGAQIFESQPEAALTDPMLVARGQCWGKPLGLNWSWFFVTYPAQVFPMGPSWQQGINDTVGAIQNFVQGNFVLDGYSQGAIVTSHVWRDEILKPQGRLHNRLNDCLGVIEYGPPCRCPGYAFGNTILCGQPVPPAVDGVVTGGIAGPDDLKPEELYFPAGHPLAGQVAVYQHCAVGDLYGDCPTGENPWATALTWKTEAPAGYDENLIYELVQTFDGQNVAALLTQALSLLGITITDATTLPGLILLLTAVIQGATGGSSISIPATGVATPQQVVGLIEAIINGGMFLAQGTGPHSAYDSGPAAAWLTQLGMAHASTTIDHLM